VLLVTGGEPCGAEPRQPNDVLVEFASAGLGDTPEPVYSDEHAALAGQKDARVDVNYGKSCGKAADCCCECCGNDTWACWTVSAGWLYMKRQSPDPAVLFSNPLDPAEALDASDFNFDFRSGFEVGVTRHDLWRCWDLEAKVFMIDGWSDTVAASSTGPVTRIHTAPPIDLPGGRDITSAYSSKLTNFELNLRRRGCRLPRVRWLAGIRYLELDEQSFTSFVSPTVPGLSNEYQVITQNRLLGFQVGGDLDIWNTNRFCLRCVTKLGVYNNEANNNSRVGASGPPPISFFAGQRGSHTSFVGELGLSARYCCTKRLALRADYRALWIDGVSLASDQPAATSFLTSAGIDTTGGTLYHGLFLGADFSF
jgi:hypothetical protein